MRVRLKSGLMIVTGESAEEIQELANWSKNGEGHVFSLICQPDGQTFRMQDLGCREDACREPINVTSRSSDPAIQLISNFAHTSFELDGIRYASVESFWQGLKFPEQSRRLQIAPLHGDDARRAGFDAVESATIEYREKSIRVGTSDHWRLMAFACWAKFNQCEPARQALLGTGLRPLIHKTRRDSRNIPGVVMSDIWMKVRKGLINRLSDVDDVADADDGEDDDDRPH